MKPLSNAMKRFEMPDKDNLWYMNFRYSPAFGLGYEKGVTRRDPSCILKANDKYYVWYTRTQFGPEPVGHDNATDTSRATPWDLADVWYATSEDGHHWEEQGPAVERGAKGDYDERSVFTPDVLYHDGRYYIVYQVTTAPTYRCTPESIAIAYSDNPDGPWIKSAAPIVEPDPSGEVDEKDLPENATVQGTWDSLRVHDPALLFRDGKFWLYYKGEGIGYTNWESKWGVAVADKAEGPYIKSSYNPITNSGHEIMVWNYDGGVAGLVTRVGPEKNTIQFAKDGVNFEIQSSIVNPPHASGSYRLGEGENNSDPLAGLSWGLSHISVANHHAIMQGEDMLGMADIDEPSDFIIRWERDSSISTFV